MEQDFKRYRALTYEGVSASVMTSVTTKFLPLLALHLGASNAAIGAVVSVPSAVSLLGYIPAAIMVERMKNVKRFCALASFLSRVVWFFVAFLPFLPFMGNSVSLLVLTASISSLVGAFINPAWATLVGNLIPTHVRGRYFGMKDRLSGIFSLATLFVAGFLIDFLGKTSGFFILFLLAGVAGILTSFFFMRVKENPNQAADSKGILRELKGVLRNKLMKRFLLSLLVWQFGVYVASPFFNVYLIQEVGAPYSWISLLLLAAGAGGILMYKAWGTFSDRFGPRMAMVFSATGACLVPILWFFFSSLKALVLIEFMSGAVWAGLNMAYFTYMFEISKDGRRSLYSAIFMSVMGLPVIFAPVVGGYIADAVFLPIAGGVQGIRAAMLVSFALRAAGLVLFAKFLIDTPLREKVSAKYITHEILNVGRYHATMPFILVKRGSVQLAFASFSTLKRKMLGVRKARLWKSLPASAKREIMEIEKDITSIENEIKTIEMKEGKKLAKLMGRLARNGKKLTRILSGGKPRQKARKNAI